jgi:6-phosphogluconate dehydrogenase
MAVTVGGCKVVLIGLGGMGRNLRYNTAAHTYGRVDQPGVFHTEWGKA